MARRHVPRARPGSGFGAETGAPCQPPPEPPGAPRSPPSAPGGRCAPSDLLRSAAGPGDRGGLVPARDGRRSGAIWFPPARSRSWGEGEGAGGMFFLFRGPQRRGTSSPTPPACRGTPRRHGPGRRGTRGSRPAPRLRGPGTAGTAGSQGRLSRSGASPVELRRAAEEPWPRPPLAFGQVTGGGDGPRARWVPGVLRAFAGRLRDWGTAGRLPTSGAGNNPKDYARGRGTHPPAPALHIPRYSIKTSNPRWQPRGLRHPAHPGPGMSCGAGAAPSHGQLHQDP